MNSANAWIIAILRPWDVSLAHSKSARQSRQNAISSATPVTERKSDDDQIPIRLSHAVQICRSRLVDDDVHDVRLDQLDEAESDDRKPVDNEQPFHNLAL